MVDKLEAFAEMDAARASAAELPEWKKDSIARGWAAEMPTMTASAPTEPVERCECGLVPYSSAITGLDAFSCCFARDGNTMAKLNCAKRTIARLRSENATLRERNQHLEEAVVEAAIVWNQGVPLTDDDEPIFTQNDELGKAVDALLAHRAQKVADDGTSR